MSGHHRPPLSPLSVSMLENVAASCSVLDGSVSGGSGGASTSRRRNNNNNNNNSSTRRRRRTLDLRADLLRRSLPLADDGLTVSEVAQRAYAALESFSVEDDETLETTGEVDTAVSLTVPPESCDGTALLSVISVASSTNSNVVSTPPDKLSSSDTNNSNDKTIGSDSGDREERRGAVAALPTMDPSGMWPVSSDESDVDDGVAVHQSVHSSASKSRVDDSGAGDLETTLVGGEELQARRGATPRTPATPKILTSSQTSNTPQTPTTTKTSATSNTPATVKTPVTFKTHTTSKTSTTPKTLATPKTPTAIKTPATSEIYTTSKSPATPKTHATAQTTASTKSPTARSRSSSRVLQRVQSATHESSPTVNYSHGSISSRGSRGGAGIGSDSGVSPTRRLSISAMETSRADHRTSRRPSRRSSVNRSALTASGGSIPVSEDPVSRDVERSSTVYPAADEPQREDTPRLTRTSRLRRSGSIPVSEDSVSRHVEHSSTVYPAADEPQREDTPRLTRTSRLRRSGSRLGSEVSFQSPIETPISGNRPSPAQLSDSGTRQCQTMLASPVDSSDSRRSAVGTSLSPSRTDSQSQSVALGRTVTSPTPSITASQSQSVIQGSTRSSLTPSITASQSQSVVQGRTRSSLTPSRTLQSQSKIREKAIASLTPQSQSMAKEKTGTLPTPFRTPQSQSMAKEKTGSSMTPKKSSRSVLSAGRSVSHEKTSRRHLFSRSNTADTSSIRDYSNSPNIRRSTGFSHTSASSPWPLHTSSPKLATSIPSDVLTSQASPDLSTISASSVQRVEGGGSSQSRFPTAKRLRLASGDSEPVGAVSVSRYPALVTPAVLAVSGNVDDTPPAGIRSRNTSAAESPDGDRGSEWSLSPVLTSGAGNMNVSSSRNQSSNKISGISTPLPASAGVSRIGQSSTRRPPSARLSLALDDDEPRVHKEFSCTAHAADGISTFLPPVESTRLSLAQLHRSPSMGRHSTLAATSPIRDSSVLSEAFPRQTSFRSVPEEIAEESFNTTHRSPRNPDCTRAQEVSSRLSVPARAHETSSRYTVSDRVKGTSSRSSVRVQDASSRSSVRVQNASPRPSLSARAQENSSHPSGSARAWGTSSGHSVSAQVQETSSCPSQSASARGESSDSESVERRAVVEHYLKRKSNIPLEYEQMINSVEELLADEEEEAEEEEQQQAHIDYSPLPHRDHPPAPRGRGGRRGRRARTPLSVLPHSTLLQFRRGVLHEARRSRVLFRRAALSELDSAVRSLDRHFYTRLRQIVGDTDQVQHQHILQLARQVVPDCNSQLLRREALRLLPYDEYRELVQTTNCSGVYPEFDPLLM